MVNQASISPSPRDPGLAGASNPKPLPFAKLRPPEGQAELAGLPMLEGRCEEKEFGEALVV